MVLQDIEQETIYFTFTEYITFTKYYTKLTYHKVGRDTVQCLLNYRPILKNNFQVLKVKHTCITGTVCMEKHVYMHVSEHAYICNQLVCKLCCFKTALKDQPVD